VPDVFLSYNREDQARAKLFADAFEREGLTVWWDVGLRSGEAYDEVTERALRGAKAVVVLWSKRSVDSRWVRAEATLADRNKTLVPAMVEPCERPIMFELTQTAELGHWRGAADDNAWRAFLADVRGFVAKGAPTATPPAPPPAAAAHQRATRTHRPVLAVMPFINRSGLKEDDIFAIGMVEDIIDALSLARTLRVLSSGATAAYRKNAADMVEGARQNNVRYLLEGNVRRVGETLRVTAQLIDAADGAIMWTQKFDRPLSELAALQEDLVLEVARHLGSEISRIEMERALKKPGDLNAWEASLRSMSASTRGQWAHAIAEGERAVALAPDVATAHATLAFALSGMVATYNDGASRPRALTHIARALELDASNPMVHLWVGWSLCWCHEPEQGLPYLQQAVQARPANAVAHHGLGCAYTMLNRDDEALAEWDAAERLAPNAPSQCNISAFIGITLIKQRKLEAALERFVHSARLMPTFNVPKLMRPLALDLLGRDGEALLEMRRAVALNFDPAEMICLVAIWWRNHPDAPTMRDRLQKLWDAASKDDTP